MSSLLVSLVSIFPPLLHTFLPQGGGEAGVIQWGEAGVIQGGEAGVIQGGEAAHPHMVQFHYWLIHWDLTVHLSPQAWSNSTPGPLGLHSSLVTPHMVQFHTWPIGTSQFTCHPTHGPIPHLAHWDFTVHLSPHTWSRSL